MDERPQPGELNPGYPLGQMARDLKTASEHCHAEVRARASHRAQSWWQVFQGMLSGALQIGSRNPIVGAPIWATPEVLTGGFSTGKLLAEEPPGWREQELAQQLDLPAERGALNRGLLQEKGLEYLLDRLEQRDYRLDLPEEGALLAVAWLAAQHQMEPARALLQQLDPWMDRLRFFPLQPGQARSGCLLQDLAQTRADLQKITIRPRFQAMRHSIRERKPLLDRLTILWMETREGDWPAQHYPEDWSPRAEQWLQDWQCLPPSAWASRGSHAHLRECLIVALRDPQQLSGRQVGKIRKILNDIQRARGLPGSPQHEQLRQAQRAQTDRVTTAELAPVLLNRLPESGELDRVQDWLSPVSAEEAERWSLPEGQPLPFAHQLQRSWRAPLADLVEAGVVGSSEVLARVLPQLTGPIEAAACADPSLAYLIENLYRAFRQRRSLLLLHLQSQVRWTELPWIQALQPWRQRTPESKAAADRLLRQAVSLWIQHWPQSIAPNRLVKELRALRPDLPLTEELAVDIFQGDFSEKFLLAAQASARLLRDSVYQRYYDLPVEPLLALNDVAPSRYKTPVSAGFTALCRERAGPYQGGNRQAYHGRIIEQQQILTTHNLAVLTQALNLEFALTHTVHCLEAIGRMWPHRERLSIDKKCAYAWRQLVFFLSQLKDHDQQLALHQGEAYLHRIDNSDLLGHWQELTRVVARKPRHNPPWLGWQTLVASC